MKRNRTVRLIESGEIKWLIFPMLKVEKMKWLKGSKLWPLNVGIYLFDFTIYFSKTEKGLKTSRGIVGAKSMGLKCSEPVEHCFPAKTSWESEIMQIVNKIIDLKLNDSMVYLAISQKNRWLLY